MVLPYLKAIFLYACFDSEEIKTSLHQVTIAFADASLKQYKVTQRKRKTKEDQNIETVVVSITSSLSFSLL